MKDVMHFAGSLAAHAVWCVAGGDTLVPILGVTGDDGQRAMHRLVYDRLERAVEAGQQKLDAPEPGARNAVLLYDGLITLDDDERTDAIMVDVRCYRGSSQRVLMAVPYQPKRGWFSRFAVHLPKFIEYTDPSAATDVRTLHEAFLAGIESHAKGAKVWHKYLDRKP